MNWIYQNVARSMAFSGISYKRAYVSRNPLVAATLPDLDKMLVPDFETSQRIPPSNVIKRDFLRALATEYMKRPCKVYTVNKLEDKVRAGNI